MASPRVGLLHDERMCGHSTPDGEPHPENPERIRAIWRKLQSEGISQRCVVLNAKEAEDKYLAAVHTQKHISLIKNISSKYYDSRRQRTAARFNSIYFNKGSSESAYLAAGSVIEVSEKVAKGDLTSAIALVRPPGHHAEAGEPMGFCLFNNVAIAANFLLNERPELGIKKILIVDWDVHHGNGTQKMFYKDPRVLFFSVHRFDSGTFYPAGFDGAYFMTGEGPGAGYNINVPWEHGKCGDADYAAVWDHVLIPVAEAFNPDFIFVSAGFDAAIADPLGGCCITPYGYSLLLQKLMGFAQGKIVMALEGGYNLESIANSVLACAKVLLHDKFSVQPLEAYPFESTRNVIQAVRHALKGYWLILATELPQDLFISCSRPSPVETDFYSSSEFDVENGEASNTVCSLEFAEMVNNDVILPLAKLNIDQNNDQGKVIASNQVQTEECSTVDDCNSWRSELSNVEIWYASYGSNAWQPRFLCYIQGGKVEGMNVPCCGSLDKSLPKYVMWKTLPHRLFFGRSHTTTGGIGGVAFLHPESNTIDKSYICMYKITLEQFNDVLLQENSLHQNSTSLQMATPFVDLSVLNHVTEKKSLSLEALKGGWYSNVLYLGKEDNLPILTMTCPVSNIEQFKSGDIPLTAPSKEYANVLVNGLVEGKQLSREEACDYINDAAIRKL